MSGRIRRYLSPSSSVRFWYLPVEYDGSTNYLDPAFYYLDFSAKLNYKGPFDQFGRPLLDYKGKVGIQYNPCAIAQYGLGALYEFGKSGSKRSLEISLSMSDWLTEHITYVADGNRLYVWLYDFDLDAYEIKAPWQSALSQGQGISLLSRMHAITGNRKYLDTALRAFQSFLIDVEKGGVRRAIDSGVVFEEAPTRRLSCILDGFIFSLLGLSDLYIFQHQAIAFHEMNHAIETLERILPQYEMRFWSRADLYNERPKMIASPFYHKLHIQQLKVLYRITNKDVFKIYSDRWNEYATNRLYFFAAMIYKIFFKLFYY